jgi:hypothetical protein
MAIRTPKSRPTWTPRFAGSERDRAVSLRLGLCGPWPKCKQIAVSRGSGVASIVTSAPAPCTRGGEISCTNGK